MSAPEMITIVVRGFGYEVTHVVTVPRASLESASWLKRPFTSIRTPVVAHCGNRVRSCQEVLVVMESGTTVKCRHCARITGITVQAETITAQLSTD